MSASADPQTMTTTADDAMSFMSSLLSCAGTGADPVHTGRPRPDPPVRAGLIEHTRRGRGLVSLSPNSVTPASHVVMEDQDHVNGIACAVMNSQHVRDR